MFWKYVQERTKSSVGVHTLKKPDGTTATTDKEKAEILNDFFSSVFVEEDKSNIPLLEEDCFSNGVSITL